MVEKIEVIDLLLKQGLITQEQLEKARGEVGRTGLSLEKALEKLGFIAEKDIVSLKAQAYGVPYMDLKDYIVDANVIKLIPENLAKKYKVVPLFKIGNSLTVAMLNTPSV
jgi:type IV pilus assembly protein PilB